MIRFVCGVFLVLILGSTHALSSISGRIKQATRRDALIGIGIGIGIVLKNPFDAKAAVTDQTNAFGNTDSDSSYSGLQDDFPLMTGSQENAIPSDEVVFVVPKKDIGVGGLGIELGEVSFRTNVRTIVKSIMPGSVAEKVGIKEDYVVVAINGQSTERTDMSGVATMFGQAFRNEDESMELRFRVPFVFQNRLNNNLDNGAVVTTQVAPEGDTTQRNPDGSVQTGRSVTSQTNQRLTVSELIAAPMCKRKAGKDDLLEISYIGKVLETGQIFDGSAVYVNGKGIPGRGNDVSLFFVLGKQPFGQFPPGWDVGLVGMCVGERRRLIIPPVLAYGSQGMPRRGIPPDATLQYDVSLISINGLATPQ